MSSAAGDLERCTGLLAELISYPTENPTGDELALCHRLADELRHRGADHVEVVEVPRPQGRCGYTYARFGEPHLLLNAHVDTVPANTGWTHPPTRATCTGERIYGLGSADTKGAIAAILTALDRQRPRNVGVLFSGDEERGGRAMRAFVASEGARSLRRAIVCEPTARCAGVRHRGVLAYRARVQGRGGHSSAADRLPRPIVTMARLAVSLDELGARHRLAGPPDMKGLCLNVASLDGGIAFNVVPDSAALIFSVRPPPGFDRDAFEAEVFRACAAAGDGITLETVVDHAPFACVRPAAVAALVEAHASGLVTLDFWTEAAELQAAGIDTVVIGPGSIAQAHGADEYIERTELAWAISLFHHVLAQHPE
jgi:acetylornithine deacetylase